MGATIGTILALVLAGVALAPLQASAQEPRDRTGFGRGLPGGSVGHPFVPAPPVIQPRTGFVHAPPMAQPRPQGFPAPSHQSFPDRERRHDRDRFPAPTVIYSAPPVIYYGVPTDDSSDAPAPVYTSAPSYDPPVVYGAPPSPEVDPTPGVIEYPTGRYELRGGGISAPQTWVWIPNPPPAPPIGPPAAPAMSPPPAPSAPTPARHATIYRWTDEQGVLHFTDSSEAVPHEYRGQAKQPPS